MNEFDLKAAEWDLNPMHWDRSEAIANEIKSLIPLNKDMTALEYGAGTGITSFLLESYLKGITLIDNSGEMVKIMDQKIKSRNMKHMKVLNFDLEHKDYKEESFDLIFTQMVLHHVKDIKSVILKFSKMLNPGGFLAIADLYTEDGSFHGAGFDGHKGFDIQELSKIVDNSHMKTVLHKQCFIINKKISETENSSFPVFIHISKKD